MKKIIFILALFVSFVANAQYTPPTGYTNINSRYDWLAGVFRALGLPAGGNAAFTTGQAQRAGSVYYDSTGVDAGLKVWNGSAWVGVGEVTQSALDDTAAAIRGDFPALVNIYNSDGALSGNRTITLSGNYLRALQGATEFLLIDPTTNNETSVLQAYNTTGSGNNAAFRGTTTATTATAFIGSSFNGAALGRLTYTSDNTGSLGTYLADLHEFTGDMRLADLAGNGTGLVGVDNLGNLTWTASPNLLFDSLGVAGISPVTTRNDTLYSRRISVTGGLTVDTTASGGLVIDASGVSGGGIANTNAGAFYRWLKPAGQEIKTFAAGYGVLIDSTTNTDALTARIDTNLISTRAWRDKLADSLGAIIDAIPAGGATGEMVKTMYLSAPTTADNITYYYSDSAITVTKVADVLTGTSPSVTYNVFFASTRNSGTPDSLFTSPRTATSVSGATTTTFNDNTIPAGSWIWLKTYATSGTVNDISVNLLYPGGGGGSGGSGANTALSNLASVEVNTSLISDADNTDDLGSSALAWKDAYAYTFKLKNASGGITTLSPTASASNFTITLPAATGTVMLLGTTQTVNGNINFTGSNSYGLVRTSNTTTTSNFSAISGSVASNQGAVSGLLVEGASGASLRALFNGTTAYTMLADNVYSNVTVGNTALTEPSSGNVPLISSLVIRAPTITGAAGTVSNTATVYIDDAPSATVSGSTYALWVKAGTAKFGGTVQLKGYTVATLPAGVQGDVAFVTDATAPTYLATVTGGGAVVTPVFFDGTNWVAH